MNIRKNFQRIFIVIFLFFWRVAASVLLYLFRGFKEIFVCVKKWLKRAFAVLVFFVVALFAGVFFLDYFAKLAINNSAEYLELRAQVEDVSIHLLTQTVIFTDIVLKNPRGFIEDDALRASKLSVKFDVFNFENPIKRIYLQNPKIKIEGRFGKRIMPKTVFQSNLFVIARETLRIFGVNVTKMVFDSARGRNKPSEEKSLAYADVQSHLKRLDCFEEIRLENVEIENGNKDNFYIGSIIWHDGILAISSVRTEIFGVKGAVKNIGFDLESGGFGLAGASIFNPEGYPKHPVVSLSKFTMKIKAKPVKNGESSFDISEVVFDSPKLNFEDKNGSMLGAIGMENNVSSIVSNFASVARIKLDDLFADEFEGIAPDEQEFKVPEFAWKNISVINARIVCRSKDAGLLANKISVRENYVDIDDVRAHMGGLKLELKGVDLDAKNQRLIASNFSLLNPAGFPEERAFRFKNFTVNTNFSEKLLTGSRVLEIKDISVKNFFVRLDSRTGDIYDLLGDDNNLYAILQTISQTATKMPVYRDAVQKDINALKDVRPRKYIISDINFSGGKIFIGPKGDAIKIPFDDVVFKDLGVVQKGLNSEQILTLILKKIIVNSIDGASDKISEEMGGQFLAPVIMLVRSFIMIF